MDNNFDVKKFILEARKQGVPPEVTVKALIDRGIIDQQGNLVKKQGPTKLSIPAPTSTPQEAKKQPGMLSRFGSAINDFGQAGASLTSSALTGIASAMLPTFSQLGTAQGAKEAGESSEQLAANIAPMTAKVLEKLRDPNVSKERKQQYINMLSEIDPDIVSQIKELNISNAQILSGAAQTAFNVAAAPKAIGQSAMGTAARSAGIGAVDTALAQKTRGENLNPTEIIGGGALAGIAGGTLHKAANIAKAIGNRKGGLISETFLSSNLDDAKKIGKSNPELFKSYMSGQSTLEKDIVPQVQLGAKALSSATKSMYDDAALKANSSATLFEPLKAKMLNLFSRTKGFVGEDKATVDALKKFTESLSPTRGGGSGSAPAEITTKDLFRFFQKIDENDFFNPNAAKANSVLKELREVIKSVVKEKDPDLYKAIVQSGLDTTEANYIYRDLVGLADSPEATANKLRTLIKDIDNPDIKEATKKLLEKMDTVAGTNTLESLSMEKAKDVFQRLGKLPGIESPVGTFKAAKARTLKNILVRKVKR